MDMTQSLNNTILNPPSASRSPQKSLRIGDLDGRRDCGLGTEGVAQFGADGVARRRTVLDCYVTGAPEAAVDAADVGLVHYIKADKGSRKVC